MRNQGGANQAGTGPPEAEDYGEPDDKAQGVEEYGTALESGITSSTFR